MLYVASFLLSPYSGLFAALGQFLKVLAIVAVGVCLVALVTAVVVAVWPVLVQLVAGAAIIALFAVATMPRTAVRS